MPKGSLATWLTTNPGLISVLGALVIFFSWAVTNTLGQRYTRMKQSVEAAESTFRLYSALHELRDQLNSVAMETVYVRDSLVQDNRMTDRPLSDIQRIRNEYYQARRSAHQVRELMDFTAQTVDFSAGVGTNTKVANSINVIAGNISAMYEEVRKRDRAAEAQASLENPDINKLAPSVNEYVRYVRSEAIPSVRGFFGQITAASNQRREEGRSQLSRAKRNATWASRAALILYIAGSILALGGQYLDKVYNKKTTPVKEIGR